MATPYVRREPARRLHKQGSPQLLDLTEVPLFLWDVLLSTFASVGSEILNGSRGAKRTSHHSFFRAPGGGLNNRQKPPNKRV